MVPALETSATSVSNAYISELFLGCVHEVQEGRPLSDALVDTGYLPDMALAMIRVGESTGALPEMLSHTNPKTRHQFFQVMGHAPDRSDVVVDKKYLPISGEGHGNCV